MGYGDVKLKELEATINAADCDVVISGTPMDFGRILVARHPVRRVSYELREVGMPVLDDVLAA